MNKVATKNQLFFSTIRKVVQLMIFIFSAFYFQANAKNSLEIKKEIIQYTVTGIIKDSNGIPLAGVNVIEKGTKNGAFSDFNGAFSLVVSEDGILNFSFLGFKDQELTLNGQEKLAITLVEDVTELDAVVITAYGTSTKKDFTGSASKVASEELTTGATASFESTLKGRVAGLNSFTSGQPGGKTAIQIRGIGSINGNKEPLYVLDGIVINTDSSLRAGDNRTGTISYNPLSTINSNDIENITVLKDAAAASLYGSRAANGVILITTKKGKTGKTEIVLDVQNGFSTNLTEEKLVNNSQFKSLWQEGQLHQYIQNNENSEFARVYGSPSLLGTYQNNAKQDYESIYGTTDANSDWLDAIYRTGSIQNYNLSFSGTEGKTSFYISGNYFNQEGTIIESDFKKYGGRINLENQSRDWLIVGNQYFYNQVY